MKRSLLSNFLPLPLCGVPFQFSLCGDSHPIISFWDLPSNFLVVEHGGRLGDQPASHPSVPSSPSGKMFSAVEFRAHTGACSAHHRREFSHRWNFELTFFVLRRTRGKENRKVGQLYDLLLMVWKKKTRNRKVGPAFQYYLRKKNI